MRFALSPIHGAADLAAAPATVTAAAAEVTITSGEALELAQIIKHDPSNEKMKLILMTSMAQRGHAARSEQVGIAGYLNKPVRQSQLAVRHPLVSHLSR